MPKKCYLVAEGLRGTQLVRQEPGKRPRVLFKVCSHTQRLEGGRDPCTQIAPGVVVWPKWGHVFERALQG